MKNTTAILICILATVVVFGLMQVFIMSSLWKISDNCGNDFQTLRRTITELKNEKIQQEQIIKNQTELITDMADKCRFD